MNNNDEYIKMILALPEEFFEDWEWHAGDQAINVLNNRTLVFLWKTETYAWYYNYHPSFSNEVSSSIKLCEIRPLPSQEQLQKISGCVDWDLYYHDLVKNYPEYDSAEQAGLAMIMYTKYGGKWNGDSWEKEE